MAKESGTGPKQKQPKVSPFSVSIWQDVENPLLWQWSIQKGTKVQKRGHSPESLVAIDDARVAMIDVLKQEQK